MQAGSSSGFARDAVAETGERPTSISFSQMSRNQVTASMGHHIWGDCIHIHRHSSTRSVAASHGKQERGRHRSRSLKCPEIKLQQAWGIISGEIAFTFTATHLQDLSQPAMVCMHVLCNLSDEWVLWLSYNKRGISFLEFWAWQCTTWNGIWRVKNANNDD
jgi:hypothetical protein